MTIDLSALDRALERPFDLSGRHILVTGAAGGIGSAAAAVVQEQGATVTLTDMVPEAAARARLTRVDTSSAYHQVNLADREAVEAMAAATGPVFAVIDTAGFCPQDDWTAPGWEDAYDAVLGANLVGPINLARAYLPAMVTAGEGRFALCGSVSGRMGGVACGPHYAASKGALHAFMRWLAQKGARHNVLANAVAPGSIETPMAIANGMTGDAYPQGRQGRPKEIGATLAFLCSPAAGFMSGAILDVNGATYFG
ncbi:SDR family oxidoreductase [Microvirga sp. SRT01]|uniref:SDR family oxidoreductase n=1 Tax=Sphingomonas longa TaxID=2778730 RepID=A0ABS2DA51_9SPHN|nr:MULTISPECIES: SDR family oxidoreductase [Alphaproteobacteria]MBM6577823.1 SDR family oxidoreductase [Sphingomonas sp. BT552]MBR7710865.1 SDR family oxidoreductase [Microvirga sp. SRT01]